MMDERLSFKESIQSFSCEDTRLFGILAEPTRGSESDLAVVIVVGGPQYRAGSHRQFVLLARHLAMGGVTSLRFDYRGMGDSVVDSPSFLGVSLDIASALNGVSQARPQVKRFVIWGLCDAASAALLYLESQRDARVVGLVLLNPWVRSVATLAQARVKHYYWRRLRQPEFWSKLFSGGIGLKTLRALATNLKLAKGGNRKSTNDSFQSRMAAGLRDFRGSTLLILSGDDYTAREFELHAGSDPEWVGLLTGSKLKSIHLDHADHTFSHAEDANRVNVFTLEWLRKELRVHVCGKPN